MRARISWRQGDLRQVDRQEAVAMVPVMGRVWGEEGWLGTFILLHSPPPTQSPCIYFCHLTSVFILV